MTVLLSVAACGNGDAAPPVVEPTWSSLDEHVLGPRCTAPCHSGGGDVAAGGLDLEPDSRLAMLEVLAGSNKCRDSGLTLLVAGDPDASLAYLKVVAKADGVDPPCGDPMPSGRSRAPLPDDQIAALRDWILAGAPAD